MPGEGIICAGLEAALEEVIFLIEEALEGGFTARALGYSIYTEADTWDELRASIMDALTCHFEEHQRPNLVRMHLVRDEVLAL